MTSAAATPMPPERPPLRREPRRCRAPSRRRRLACIGVLALCPVALVIAVLCCRLEPLAIDAADTLSVTVLDRDNRLLRAFTTPSGRWRLPCDPAQVDERYLAMLVALEDKRFFS